MKATNPTETCRYTQADSILLDNVVSREKQARTEDSLSKVIQRASPLEHSEDSVEFLLLGKSHFLKYKIKWLEAQISNRNRLRGENLDRIQISIVYFDTKLMRHDDRWRNLIDLKADQARTAIEKEIIGLEKEIEAEKVDSWKDTVALKEKLIDVLWEYELAKCRLDMLTKNGD